MTTLTAPGRLRLKIALDNLKPAIWRRVEVTDDLSFWQLHRVIQAAMGWEDYHMHEFKVGDKRIGSKTPDDFMGFGEPIISERSARLGTVLESHRKFRYWYDFGDDWWHTITVEKRLPPDPQAPAAVLVDGERACPPEDCGGPWGYADLLDIAATPDHEDHAEIVDWLGEDFDPEQFEQAAFACRVATAVRKRRQAKPAAEG